MLGKCTNPSCSISFRYLEEGMLFRLETDPALRWSNPKTPEYYWSDLPADSAGERRHHAR